MAVNINIDIKTHVKSIKALQGLPRYVYILVIITVLGMSAGLYRLYAGLGATTHLSTVFPWGLWISFDLTTVAFAGAAFTLAALVYVFHMHELHSAIRPTVLFGLLGYGSVLVILFFDLGRWDRFWHFLVYPNLTSALFEVSWCIALYSAILAYEFSPVVVEKIPNSQKVLDALGKITIPMVIAGITLSSMHQSSLGSLFVVMIHRLHPLWYSLIQPEFFLVSSLAAGIATIILGSYASIWLFGQTLSEHVLEKLGRLLPWILGFYLAMKLGDVLLGGKLDLLLTSGIFSVLYVAEIILVIIPIIWFSIRKLRSTRNAAVTGALFVAAAILLNRFDVTWFAVQSLNGVVYSPSWIEVALLAGIASGILLVYTLVAHFFPVFAETIPMSRDSKPRPATLPHVPAASRGTASSAEASPD